MTARLRLPGAPQSGGCRYGRVTAGCARQSESWTRRGQGSRSGTDPLVSRHRERAGTDAIALRARGERTTARSSALGGAVACRGDCETGRRPGWGDDGASATAFGSSNGTAPKAGCRCGRVAAAPELAPTRRPLREAKRQPLIGDCDVRPWDCEPTHGRVRACPRSTARKRLRPPPGLSWAATTASTGRLVSTASARARAPVGVIAMPRLR